MFLRLFPTQKTLASEWNQKGPVMKFEVLKNRKKIQNYNETKQKKRKKETVIHVLLQKLHTADEVQKDMAAFIFKQPGKNNLTLLSQGK